ncbi:MAG: AI-2E family transporter [candidate division KSB1 bacterium]|nr:AI-2E family transporter [candidate division KSB1 bacterium]
MKTLNPTDDSLKKLAYLVALLVMTGSFLWMLTWLKGVMAPVIISIILAFFLEPMITKMESRGFHRVGAILLVFFLLALLLAGFLKFLFPILSHEIRSLNQGLQSQSSTPLGAAVKTFLTEKIPGLQNPEIISDRFETFMISLISKSLSLIPDVISILAMLVIIPFITFFLLKEGEKLKRAIIQQLPNRCLEMSLNFCHRVNHQLETYLRSQLLLIFIMSIVSIIALYYLGLPYFFTLGILAGLASLIPYFGPILRAIPAMLVALLGTGSVISVIGIVIAFATIQLLENTFVSPALNTRSRGVKLHPLLVLLLILIGGTRWGVLGTALVLPVACVAKIVLKELIRGFRQYRLI